MSFKALVNKVTSKFEQIGSAIPDIAADIQGGINNTLNQFKVDGINNVLGQIEGFSNMPKDGSLFACMHPNQFKSNLKAKPGPIGFSTKALAYS